MSGQPKTLRILQHTDVQFTVMTVQQMAKDIGMSSGAAASIATAVSELCTNITKYARMGRVRLRSVNRRGQPGIEAFIEDSGPGIENLEEAMTDNFSSGGTLGLGLPGAKRLVDEFDVKTEVGKGTQIRVVKWG
jgi:serine/threonine-protein kinase RsbT